MLSVLALRASLKVQTGGANTAGTFHVAAFSASISISSLNSVIVQPKRRIWTGGPSMPLSRNVRNDTKPSLRRVPEHHLDEQLQRIEIWLQHRRVRIVTIAGDRRNLGLAPRREFVRREFVIVGGRNVGHGRTLRVGSMTALSCCASCHAADFAWSILA